MITVSNQTDLSKAKGVVRKDRSYADVVEFLDSIPGYEYGEASLKRVKALDKLLDYPSQKVDTILVGGTNGKSSTINFAARLLKEEGFKVGMIFSTHFLNYNERLLVDFQAIANKSFAEGVNEVITVAQLNDIHATAFEILMFAALRYFKAENVDVAFLEIGLGGTFDATAICTPKIVALTRIAFDHPDVLGKDLDQAAFEMLGAAKKGTWGISAEQSKIRLQKMKDWADKHEVSWAMPIRKLASLPYIFEQLYGRIASLAERIAQIYVECIKMKFSPFLRGNLLATERGQRGRPTLEAKRQAQLNPLKTLKGFWAEQFNLLRGRFEVLDKEKPTVLLDNARNVDAFNNLFLGIRLLHYQRPLKGFALIIGVQRWVDITEFIKSVRYLLKKVGGTVFFIPLQSNEQSHNPQDLAAIAKEMNIKVRACTSFEQAFEMAKNVVDDRHGLICVTGSVGIVKEYWRARGIKKL